MDTQGLFDQQTTQRQNAVIYSLSALCSSVSIYNVIEDIDETGLEQIKFFSGYANMVGSEKSSEEGEDVTTSDKLIFLIRNFDNEDQFGYGYHGMNMKPQGKENLYEKIFDTNQDQKCPLENKFVRKNFLESYSEVGIYILPDPGKTFRANDQGEPDADFKENMTAFVEFINSSHLVTKQIGNHEVTGLEFRKYIREWAELCKDAEKHFPKVQTILESTTIIRNTLVLNTSFSYFGLEIGKFIQNHPYGVQEDDLRKLRKTLEKKALKLFNDMAKFGNESTQQRFRTMLIEHFEKNFQGNLQMNLLNSEKARINKQFMEQKDKV